MHKDTTYQGSDRQDFYRHGKKIKQIKQTNRTHFPTGIAILALACSPHGNTSYASYFADFFSSSGELKRIIILPTKRFEAFQNKIKPRNRVKFGIFHLLWKWSQFIIHISELLLGILTPACYQSRVDVSIIVLWFPKLLRIEISSENSRAKHELLQGHKNAPIHNWQMFSGPVWNAGFLFFDT